MTWYRKIIVAAPSCPTCGSPMVLRVNRNNGNQFWGCSSYPRCKGTLGYRPNQPAGGQQPQQAPQQAPQAPQQQQPQNWYNKNVKKPFYLATMVADGRPVAMSQGNGTWDWVDENGQTGSFPTGSITTMVKSVRDQNNKPYSSMDPQELFNIFKQTQTQNTPQPNQEQKRKWYLITDSQEQGAIEDDQPKPQYAASKAIDGGTYWEIIGTDGDDKIPGNRLEIDYQFVRDPQNQLIWSYDPQELLGNAAQKAETGIPPTKDPNAPQIITPEDRIANTIPENKMSAEQKGVEHAFSQTDKSIMIDALAGSGKTTLLKHLAWKFGQAGQRWLYLVFNTKNKVEAKQKFPTQLVQVDSTNGFLGRVLDNASQKGVIPQTKRMKSLEPRGKVAKADQVPQKVELLVDGPDFGRMMSGFRLAPLMPANNNFGQAEGRTVAALLKQIRGDFRKAVLTLTDLSKAFAIDPRKKDTLKGSIAAVLDKYDIDYDLQEVKQRISKYQGNFQTKIRAALGQILGFDIMQRSFRDEVMQSCAWLLNESLPGASKHVFNYKGQRHNLGEFRDFSDDLWYAAINAGQIDWTNGTNQNYTHVLADEVQDFNECQKIALSHMKGTGSKVVAVGDPNQSIYRFRGADSAAFGNIAKMLDSDPHSLSLNFRSRPGIIEFCNNNTKVKNLKAGLKIKPEEVAQFLTSYQNSPADVDYVNKSQETLGTQLTPETMKMGIDNGQIPWPPMFNGQATMEEKEYDNIFNEISQERQQGNNVQTAFIARTNAPLANAALKLLGQGVPFVIVGKDIANDLVKHVNTILYAKTRDNRLDSLTDASSLMDFSNKLQTYMQNEQNQHANKSAKRGYLQDLTDTTNALESCIQQFDAGALTPPPQPAQDENFYDEDRPAPVAPPRPMGGSTIGGFKKWLNEKLGGLDLDGNESDVLAYQNTVEKDKKKAPVVLTTAHKSKGLEFSRVFVLRNDLFPHPRATRQEDLEQEANGKYVTYTRAMDQLHVVKLKGQPGFTG